MKNPKLPYSLIDLRNRFRENGYDIKLVGGCVRDWLINEWKGKLPHDIDLCTDANPDEQRAIYRTYNVRHIDTGLQHGTWTVVLDDIAYEITSLRTETDCDGRHAKVSYTHDWLLDLSRRDLTINAMNMSFEGKISDPFDGQEDLSQGIIRFVGEPGERIREDYLRILRWFRFHGRFSKGHYSPIDADTMIEIEKNMHGLQKISRERVWSEFSRIISGENGLLEILEIMRSGIASHIDFPVPSIYDHNISFIRLENAYHFIKDPVTLIAIYLGSKDNIENLASKWHWSNHDRQKALLICEFLTIEDKFKMAKYKIAIEDVPIAWLIDTLYAFGKPTLAKELKEWKIPVFPVGGDDLLATGMKQSPAIGKMLSVMRNIWAESDYKMKKNDIFNLCLNKNLVDNCS